MLRLILLLEVLNLVPGLLEFARLLLNRGLHFLKLFGALFALGIDFLLVLDLGFKLGFGVRQLRLEFLESLAGGGLFSFDLLFLGRL